MPKNPEQGSEDPAEIAKLTERLDAAGIKGPDKHGRVSGADLAEAGRIFDKLKAEGAATELVDQEKIAETREALEDTSPGDSGVEAPPEDSAGHVQSFTTKDLIQAGRAVEASEKPNESKGLWASFKGLFGR